MIDAPEPLRAARSAPASATAVAVPDADPMRVALEVEIPSDVRYIERIVALVVRQCVDFDYPKHACTLNVPVALSEALSNAILRGNRENPALAVRVRACVDAREMVLEVEDEGEGFEIEKCAKDPTLPENLEREDGRGLFLMRRLMDRVERFQDADGNVVRLVLHRGTDGA